MWDFYIRSIFVNVVASRTLYLKFERDTIVRIDRKQEKLKKYIPKDSSRIATVLTRVHAPYNFHVAKPKAANLGRRTDHWKMLRNDGRRRVERDWKSSFIWKLIRGSGGESTIRSQHGKQPAEIFRNYRTVYVISWTIAVRILISLAPHPLSNSAHVIAGDLPDI